MNFSKTLITIMIVPLAFSITSCRKYSLSSGERADLTVDNVKTYFRRERMAMYSILNSDKSVDGVSFRPVTRGYSDLSYFNVVFHYLISFDYLDDSGIYYPYSYKLNFYPDDNGDSNGVEA